MTGHEATFAEPDYRLNLLRPGSILVEKYQYATARQTTGVQWCVHRVEGDESLTQLYVTTSRRKALAWAAEHV